VLPAAPFPSTRRGRAQLRPGRFCGPFIEPQSVARRRERPLAWSFRVS
jgi:hypothetical protein